MNLEVFDYREYPNAELIVSSWWEERKDGPFPSNLLPPVGVVVTVDGEPAAALWMYMAVGCGVAFLEWPVTAPGLGAKAATPMRFAIEALAAVAKAHDYGLLRVSTLPKIARFLQREGWKLEDSEVRIPLMLKI